MDLRDLAEEDIARPRREQEQDRALAPAERAVGELAAIAEEERARAIAASSGAPRIPDDQGVVARLDKCWVNR